MNKQHLQQRLAKLSGMAHSIYVLSDNDHLDSLAMHLEEGIDDVINRLDEDEDLECQECITDALKMFNNGYPGKEVIQAYAKDLHKNYHHTSKECPGFGPAYNDTSVDRCHGCGQFHD